MITFSRLAAETSTGHEILPLLADAAIHDVGADGAVVIEVTEQGALRVAASRQVPAPVERWAAGDADALGGYTGRELLQLCGGAFEAAQTLPLVSTGGLFGALVLFFAPGNAWSERQMELARGLVDLAAIAVARAAQIAKLAQANAELRASREVLARTEKLRALGQMAAGVSHDLKNILNPISMHAQLIQRALARGDVAQANESLAEARAAVRRGTEMLDRLRIFSQQAPAPHATTVDLNALVRESMAIARPRMSSGGNHPSRVAEELGAPPPVLARGDEVVAAVVNLIVNAIDAMPAGGTIRVVTGASKGGAFVTVSDTGPGMTPEVQARVFEPFFTTKGALGTGLGLAMVFATMQRYGGTVSLESEPGRGASFTLWFPAQPAPAAG